MLLGADAHFCFVTNVFGIIKRKSDTPYHFLMGCSDKSGALAGILLPAQGHSAV